MAVRATPSAKLVFAFGPLRPAELFAEADAARLAALCTIADATPLRRFDDPRALALLAEAEILVTGWGCPPIDASVLALAPRLKLIAHAAGSIRGWATDAIFARTIAIVTAADANALPVAEFTVAAILFANKRVLAFSALYRRERRPLELYLAPDTGAGNWQKTIGIVGASRIGRRVVELLRPYDLSILLYDPFVSPDEVRRLGAEPTELDALLAASDVVSLHAPSLPATRHLLDARRLALLRDGATLVNTARGALVDQDALIAELQAGRIGAVLDVTEPETLPPESPLYELSNVLLTPHLAGAVGTERQRFGHLVVGEIDRFMRGLPLRHAVDPATVERQA